MAESGADAHLVAALSAYALGEELGRGATGIVVEGRHRSLDREVAVKRLPQMLGSDHELRARFLSEARVLASLDHPHIVPVYDFVEGDGVCALVMERLHGGTVWDRYKAEGFTGPAACAVVLATALALHYAHGKGVLHRDIKPENLLFSADEVLKVTDFGIAKVLDDARTRLTQEGMLIGTPAYMAPEQAQGAELGPYTDVYAAGTVLYVLLCGQLPFAPAYEPVAQVYQRVHEDPIGLLERDPRAPAALHEVTSRALARDPAARYPTALHLARAIDEAASREWGPDWRAGSGVVVRGSPGDGRPPSMPAHEATPTIDVATVGALHEPEGPGEAHHVAGPDEELVRALEESLVATAGQEDATRVRLLARLAVELQLTDSVDRRDALSREAMELAARLGDRPLELLVLYSRVTATWSPDGLESRRAATERIVRVARTLEDAGMAFRGRRLRLRALLEAGEIEEGDRAIAALAADAGDDWQRWQARLCQAMRALHEGRADEGERLALEAYEIGRHYDGDLAGRCLDAQIARHRWLAGRTRELVPLLRDAHERSPWLAVREAALIFGLVELDRRTEAVAHLERLAGDSFDAVPYDGNWLLTMTLLSTACARLGDGRRTELLYDALRPFADRLAVDSDCTTLGAPVAAALGILAAAQARFDDADEHFQRALAHTSACGADAQTSFVQGEYARMFLVRGRTADTARAAALLEQAVATADARGLAGLSARAWGLQSRSRGSSG